MTEYRFLEPLDVLYLRGNKLFGEAGTHGEALMPPWPSLAAGALRSYLLVSHGVHLAAFAAGKAQLEPPLAACLGAPNEPGTFRIALFALGQRKEGVITPCFPLPADVVVLAEDAGQVCLYLQPQALHTALASSYLLLNPPVMRTTAQAKPASGWWLNAEGLAAYLAGETLSAAHLTHASNLWRFDPRLGIALDSDHRTAAQGMLYTAETIAMCPDTGFLVGVDGADGLLPETGVARFGGDGRGVRLEACAPRLPQPHWEQIMDERRCRVVLSTPGLFRDGWRPPGLEWNGSHWVWQSHSFKARLVSANINRAETVSGWDLATWRPKPALRAAPTGSVYWFDQLEGEIDSLCQLAAEGFWRLSDYPDKNRRAEGFNNLSIAAWPR